ncbi:hypothetical protein M5K25_018324 [Dendrobium thyrsiflorum]|uniref:Uncharacterized protein n=1 Tax=Dendrobium thyrsiflorum TaxID=117978 RepID=A0ABD0UQ98_DENTH
MTNSSSSLPSASAFPNGKSRSFKDALAGSSAGSPSLQFVQTSFKGCPTLILRAPFALTLVGKFMLRRPNLDVIRKFFANLKLSDSFHIGLWTRGIFRFILLMIWIIVGFSPGEPITLHFFNSQILFGLASIFGKPLQTDQATASISRPSVARVLVELDISKKHPDEIWLGSELNGYFQKVDFENLPIFCSHCKMHGQGLKECFRLYPHLRKEKESSK